MGKISNIIKRKVYFKKRTSLRKIKGTKAYEKHIERLIKHREKVRERQQQLLIEEPVMEDLHSPVSSLELQIQVPNGEYEDFLRRGGTSSSKDPSDASKRAGSLGVCVLPPVPKAESSIKFLGRTQLRMDYLQEDDIPPDSSPARETSASTVLLPSWRLFKVDVDPPFNNARVWDPCSLDPRLYLATQKVQASEEPAMGGQGVTEEISSTTPAEKLPAEDIGANQNILVQFLESGVAPFSLIHQWAGLCITAAGSNNFILMEPVLLGHLPSTYQLPRHLRREPTYLWPIQHHGAYFLFVWAYKKQLMDCIPTSVSSAAPSQWAKDHFNSMWQRDHRRQLDWTNFQPLHLQAPYTNMENSGTLLCILEKAVIFKEPVNFSDDCIVELRHRISESLMNGHLLT